MTSGYDIIIRNARVVDGTGNPWSISDVAVKQGKIVALGDLEALQGEFEFDCQGEVLAPGFIDIHTHADAEAVTLPLMENYVQQGVTTLLGGNCGNSQYPIGKHLQTMALKPLGPNYGIMVGQGTIRQQVVGNAMRDATDHELDEMCSLTAQAFEQGAKGLSLGLYYAPGSYTNSKELHALAAVAANYKRLVTIHLRDESDYSVGLIASVKEAIEIARDSQASVQIAHLKCLGRSVWGKANEVLGLIEKARDEGLDVTFDQYPYLASGTSIRGALIPRWALDGGEEELAERFNDKDVRAQVRKEMLANIERRGGAKTLSVAVCRANPAFEGKNLAEIGTLLGKEPVDTAIEMQQNGGASLVSFNMIEDDLVTILKHPLGMVVSDGRLVEFGQGVPHPRYYGTFPRVLALYVRDNKVITLEEAIRKMTSAPARRVGLWSKGLIAPGMDADLVVFDANKIQDNSSFDTPHQYNTGVKLVIVNGKLVLKDGKVTSERPGRVLL